MRIQAQPAARAPLRRVRFALGLELRFVCLGSDLTSNLGLGLGVDLAVGAHLAAYSFTLKTKPTSPFDPRLEEPLQEKLKFEPLEKSKEWDEGVQYASAQNLARTVC